jgi:quercetin dioxygenase-like cupin family protein
MTSLKNSPLESFGLQVWSGNVNTSYPPHRHNEVELNAIESGYFTYMLAGRQVSVQAGNVALFSFNTRREHKYIGGPFR